MLLAALLGGCRSSILDAPSTQIQYQLPQKAHVKITIENSYNTVIATLLDSPKEAGYLQVTYNPPGLLEGVYYYTVEAKGIDNSYYYKETKAMLLVK
ncbi:MAG: hypothetical protein HYV28_15530 [Ignavibacteriales bacterium]|nr:hypothetical protein [Ignavibacteriales bacterium]